MSGEERWSSRLTADLPPPWPELEINKFSPTRCKSSGISVHHTSRGTSTATTNQGINQSRRAPRQPLHARPTQVLLLLLSRLCPSCPRRLVPLLEVRCCGGLDGAETLPAPCSSPLTIRHAFPSPSFPSPLPDCILASYPRCSLAPFQTSGLQNVSLQKAPRLLPDIHPRVKANEARPAQSGACLPHNYPPGVPAGDYMREQRAAASWGGN
ncbi:hypothetical protein O3P69_020522 [Scylla paramamosain]|uniref:Uncharacterized protein n=1 Tax=Scylla paramamosain TaxID=85552 RepID=A0AAW0TML1_SCYPA